MTEKTENIYMKLQAARCELQKRNLKKSGKNSYSNFMYYELADFLPATNEVLEKVGLCPVFFISNGNAYLRIYADKEQMIEFVAPTAEAGIKGATAIQNLGALITYMRRYMYMLAMEIVENDAIDPLDNEKKNITSQTQEEPKNTAYSELTPDEKKVAWSRQASSWKSLIKACKDASRLNIYYEVWKGQFPAASNEYKELIELSTAVKNSLKK